MNALIKYLLNKLNLSGQRVIELTRAINSFEIFPFSECYVTTTSLVICFPFAHAWPDFIRRKYILAPNYHHFFTYTTKLQNVVFRYLKLSLRWCQNKRKGGHVYHSFEVPPLFLLFTLGVVEWPPPF